jgi:uncharacterized protein YndB with AHSA1/START domain
MIRPAHSTFVVERCFRPEPSRVFRYFSDPAFKARWATCHPDWKTVGERFDFFVGGGELSRQLTPNGILHEFRSHYLDIIDSERIVYAYAMSAEGRCLSSSMTTLEFLPTAAGTLLVFTEQIAFLAGDTDFTRRQQGTASGLDRLNLTIERDLATIQ